MNYNLKSIDVKAVSLDFPSTTALSSTEILVPFTGVVLEDFVVIDAKFPINTSFIAWVSAINSVTVRFTNFTGNTMNLSKFNVRILVIKQSADIPLIPPITAITLKIVSTSRALVLDDANKLLDITGQVTLTIPSEASVNFPIGTEIYFNQSSIGEVVITPQQGVTIQSFPGRLGSRTLGGQFGQAYIIKKGLNLWSLAGNLK